MLIEQSLEGVRKKWTNFKLGDKRRKKEHSICSRDGKPARTVELKISWGEMEIQPPRIDIKAKNPITACCIRCWNEEENL